MPRSGPYLVQWCCAVTQISKWSAFPFAEALIDQWVILIQTDENKGLIPVQVLALEISTLSHAWWLAVYEMTGVVLWRIHMYYRAEGETLTENLFLTLAASQSEVPSTSCWCRWLICWSLAFLFYSACLRSLYNNTSNNREKRWTSYSIPDVALQAWACSGSGCDFDLKFVYSEVSVQWFYVKSYHHSVRQS